MPVDVIERVAQVPRNSNGALRRKLFLLIEHLAEQPALHPIQDHIPPAAVLIAENSYNPRMIELLADIFLTLKPVKEDRIGFHFRVRDFYGDGAAVPDVGAAKNRGHSTSGCQTVQAVMIELVSNAGFWHLG